MASAAKSNITKSYKPDPVLDLKQRRDSLRESRINADEERDDEKVDELTRAIGILDGMASLTPAISVEGALFQLDLAIPTLECDLIESIPVEIPRVFDHERKIARLLESVARGPTRAARQRHWPRRTDRLTGQGGGDRNQRTTKPSLSRFRSTPGRKLRESTSWPRRSRRGLLLLP